MPLGSTSEQVWIDRLVLIPQADSPAIFSALLDAEKGGYFSIRPSVSFESVQNYLDDTVVVETLFSKAKGNVKLLDAFVVMTENEKSFPFFLHEILRIVQCTSGKVDMEMNFEPTIL